LYVFQAEDKGGRSWKRTVLDAGGIAAADCKIGKFVEGRLLSIACSGASTGNVRLYVPR
jgi:hypothetical protein